MQWCYGGACAWILGFWHLVSLKRPVAYKREWQDRLPMASCSPTVFNLHPPKLRVSISWSTVPKVQCHGSLGVPLWMGALGDSHVPLLGTQLPQFIALVKRKIIQTEPRVWWHIKCNDCDNDLAVSHTGSLYMYLWLSILHWLTERCSVQTRSRWLTLLRRLMVWITLGCLCREQLCKNAPTLCWQA